MNSSLILEIEKLIIESTKTLKKSLDNYWPVINPEKNGIQEANLTFHLAHACISKGLFCYPEASDYTNRDGNKRVDLLVNGKLKSDSTTFLVESKKLYSSEQALRMFKDFSKMKYFSPVSNEINRPKYAVLLAVTVSLDNVEWWNDPYLSDSKDWDALTEVLLNCEIHKHVSIDTRYKQHIVYAITEIPST